MKPELRKYFLVSLVILVLLGVFAGVRLKQLKAVPLAPASAGYPVVTATAVKQPITAGLTYVGTLEPWQEVDLAPKISARILALAGNEGESLQQGQLAVRLDNGDLTGRITSLSKKVQTAKVNLNYWNRQVESNQVLFAEGAISEQNFQQVVFSRDTARSSFEEAGATLAEARIALENSTIFAPLNGTIINVYSNPGDLATPGKAILTVADTSRLKAVVKVVEADLMKLKPGSPVTLTLTGSDQTYNSTIMTILPSIDRTARTGAVEIAIPSELNKEYNLKPGMSIDIFFILGAKQETLVIPKQSVQYEGKDAYVYQVKDGKAVKHKVITGLNNDKLIEITQGLTEGQHIINSSLTEIYDGRLLYVTGVR